MRLWRARPACRSGTPCAFSAARSTWSRRRDRARPLRPSREPSPSRQSAGYTSTALRVDREPDRDRRRRARRDRRPGAGAATPPRLDRELGAIAREGAVHHGPAHRPRRIEAHRVRSQHDPHLAAPRIRSLATGRRPTASSQPSGVVTRRPRAEAEESRRSTRRPDAATPRPAAPDLHDASRAHHRRSGRPARTLPRDRASRRWRGGRARSSSERISPSSRSRHGRSSAPSGSSSISSRGSTASARASATRCCSPPDSPATRRSRQLASSPTSSSTSATRRRRSSRLDAGHAQTERRRCRQRRGAGTARTPGT